MRSAVPSPLAVCAVWESLSDFQLCEGLNRPSVSTVLSGIVAPRVFFPSNSHQYFACALTYCSLSPCLDSFIWSPERRGKPTNYFIRGCSSPCLPPLQQSPVLGNCYLSPYLDRFVQSPERRGKPTKNLVRSCSSSCAPPLPPPPLTTATVLCICSNLSFSVALSWSVNIRSFFFCINSWKNSCCTLHYRMKTSTMISMISARTTM